MYDSAQFVSYVPMDAPIRTLMNSVMKYVLHKGGLAEQIRDILSQPVPGHLVNGVLQTLDYVTNLLYRHFMVPKYGGTPHTSEASRRLYSMILGQYALLYIKMVLKSTERVAALRNPIDFLDSVRLVFLSHVSADAADASHAVMADERFVQLQNAVKAKYLL